MLSIEQILPIKIKTKNMSSFFSRLMKSSLASKRLVSQLTQRGEGKLTAFLRQLGLQRVLDGKGIFAKRGIATTPTLADKPLTDDMELATGIFKRELKLRMSGNNDPWSMAEPLKRGAGTADKPTEIPSVFEARMVGCLCMGDRVPKWMWLEQGDPKRCECGHYFVLKKGAAI